MKAVQQPKRYNAYELRFCSLFREGSGYAFPCDADGRVDIDALSERARSNYFYARSLIGRELSLPAVLKPVAPSSGNR